MRSTSKSVRASNSVQLRGVAIVVVDVIGELLLMILPQNIDQISRLSRDRPKANGKFAIG